MRQVSRDPFARQTVYRRRVYATKGCLWCGQSHKTPSQMRSYNFAYHVESDGGAKRDIAGEFCSIGCMRSYHQ
jgi:hypothetical protein